MAPIASAHEVTDAVTWMLSTSTRNESTSMSNRAPSADTVLVRRATWPSTPSRASATAASTTRVTTGVTPPAIPWATSAATPPTSTDRARVIRSARTQGRRPGPAGGAGEQDPQRPHVDGPHQPSQRAEASGGAQRGEHGQLRGGGQGQLPVDPVAKRRRRD